MLAINLATRGRPELLIPTIKQTLENVRDQKTMLVVSVDEDDDKTISALAAPNSPVKIEISIRRREDSLGTKYNRVLDLFPDATCYLAMVDYAPHITPGFDVKILEAASQFPDGIGVIYNRWANLSFPQINAVTAKMAKLMGYFYPPYFPYWFIDHWLDDIARMIDRISYVDVEIDCSHRPGTQEFREPAFWSHYFDFLASERHQLALNIINKFNEREWRKLLLIQNCPYILQHSAMVNSFTARAVGKLLYPPYPPRYQRLKTAALTKMGLPK